jgi:hypothetical protein
MRQQEATEADQKSGLTHLSGSHPFIDVVSAHPCDARLACLPAKLSIEQIDIWQRRAAYAPSQGRPQRANQAKADRMSKPRPMPCCPRVCMPGKLAHAIDRHRSACIGQSAMQLMCTSGLGLFFFFFLFFCLLFNCLSRWSY